MVAAAGGYFDRILVKSENHGDDWQAVDSDEQNYYFVGFHPDEPNIVYAGDKISTDGGDSFSDIGTMPDGATDAQIFEYCYSDPDIVYALSRSKDAIYRSDDKGESWSVYSDPGWDLFKFDGVTTIALEPHECESVFTVSQDGDLAEFNGTDWRETGVLDNIIGMETANFIRGVALDPKTEGIVYAGTFLGGISTVWRSEDGGYTWEDISYNLPRTGASSIQVNPHTGELFKGGGTGTWIFPPPYDSTDLVYEKAESMPSCHDGLMNGQETGVDSGGRCDSAVCDYLSDCPDFPCKTKSCESGECIYSNNDAGVCQGTCRTCSNGYCIEDDDSLCPDNLVCEAGDCVDMCISESELNQHISDWKQGDLGMKELVEIILGWIECEN
jgi:hypothetical protein